MCAALGIVQVRLADIHNFVYTNWPDCSGQAVETLLPGVLWVEVLEFDVSIWNGGLNIGGQLSSADTFAFLVETSKVS